MAIWRYNRFGHVELWKNDDMNGESDIYLQVDYDVKAFFESIGYSDVDMIDIDDHDHFDDTMGYFDEVK